MKKYIAIIIFSVFVYSCNSNQENMVVKGKIHNFQKGKVYLEKMKDTVLVKVDSVTLDGMNTFELSDNLESPQIYYISISKSDKYLQFFAEEGEIQIISDLKTFGFKPIIKGSKNQVLLDEYAINKTKYNNLYLDLIKERFEALKNKDNELVAEIESKMLNVERRKYLYTINFANNHADYEIAPYLVLTEAPNAKGKLLDTIEKAMTTKVKNSLYGKKFMAFLKN